MSSVGAKLVDPYLGNKALLVRDTPVSLCCKVILDFNVDDENDAIKSLKIMSKNI